MNASINEKTPNEIKDIKLFTIGMIVVGTFFGGALTGGYLLFRNFKLLNQDVKARVSLFTGILLTMIIIPVFFFTLPFSFPKTLLQLSVIIWTVLAYFITTHYQKAAIDSHLQSGGEPGSGWTLLITVIISLVIIFVYAAIISAVIILYGTNTASSSSTIQSEKYWLPSNLYPLRIEKTEGVLLCDTLDIKVSEARVVGQLLTQIGYYNKKTNNEAAYYISGNYYVINLDITKEDWMKQKIQIEGRRFINLFSKSFPDHRFQVLFTSVDSLGQAMEYHLR